MQEEGVLAYMYESRLREQNLGPTLIHPGFRRLISLRLPMPLNLIPTTHCLIRLIILFAHTVLYTLRISFSQTLAPASANENKKQTYQLPVGLPNRNSPIPAHWIESRNHSPEDGIRSGRRSHHLHS